MVLVDALFINDGGGKVLLDYLILELQASNLEVYFLLDERIIGNHPAINTNNVEYLKGSYFKRQHFYNLNKNRFSKIFCFGNLPPNIRLNGTVYTYFHNLIYLDIPKEFSLLQRLKFKLKILILKWTSANTDFWLVQSEVIKNKLQKRINLRSESIKTAPFYPQFKKLDLNIKREEGRFLYVSNANPHKNHIRLINAFCIFYDQNKKGKLVLTVSNDYPEVLELIANKKNKYPIINLGFIDHVSLQKEYLSSEYFVFPSLSESLGLGIVEAIESGCKIIAADLPYTYAACDPSCTFNPLDETSIANAFQSTLKNNNLTPSSSKIENSINKIISFLK